MCCSPKAEKEMRVAMRWKLEGRCVAAVSRAHKLSLILRSGLVAE